MRTCDLAFVSAFSPELAGLRSIWTPALPPVPPERETGGERSFGSLAGLDLLAGAVGIGLVASTLGAAALLRDVTPRGVVFVGTCGAYASSGLSIGRVAVARSVRLVDPAVTLGRSAFVGQMAVELPTHAAATASLAAAGAHPCDVATTLGVTTDDEQALILAKVAAVEHLEAFGVAQAAARCGAPFTAVLGVANSVGSRGRAEWRENHEAATAAAWAVIDGWIRSGSAATAFP